MAAKFKEVKSIKTIINCKLLEWVQYIERGAQ
jgi:hypothetical protein